MKKYYLLSVLCLFIYQQSSAQIHISKRDSLMTEHTYNLNPIIVTGSGHHQRLKTTATPVHVLSSQDIKEQGLTTFSDALTRMLPQISMSPNSMGSQLRLNGLSNKYVLILINGKKLIGDMSNNIDLNRINMASVKRIEVLDGAASSLYGSDAIGGVINIITDQPTDDMLAVTSDTRVSGKGQLTQSVNLDYFKNGFGSYSSFTHDEADSYQNNNKVYVKGDDGETQLTLAPLYTGYNSNMFSQGFTYSPDKRLAMNAGAEYSYRKTDRPNTNADIKGGTDYEMRYKSLRWNVGGIYKFDDKNSIQIDFVADRYRYGKQYDVATKTYEVGDYVQSKRQKSYEGELKGIFSFLKNSTTVVGIDWRNDYLKASSGNVDAHAYTFAAYLQHEMSIFRNLKGTFGARYTYHETFGSRFTPKAVLMYSYRNFNFRATYSNGFRAPGLDELYYHYFSVNRNKPQIIFGNKNLKPEKSNYVSLNAEYRTNFLSLSVTGYMNFITDMVVHGYVETNDSLREMLLGEFPEMTPDQASKLERYSLYMNSDKGEVKGLQVNLSANIFRGFNFNANYSYTYARSKSNGAWQKLERSIKNTVTLAANYNHAWGRYRMNINVNGRLQSRTYYPSYFDAPGYGVWNINTRHCFEYFKWADIEPSIGIDNIFNRADNRIDGVNTRYALYSPGCMLVVGLRIRFKK